MAAETTTCQLQALLVVCPEGLAAKRSLKLGNNEPPLFKISRRLFYPAFFGLTVLLTGCASSSDPQVSQLGTHQSKLSQNGSNPGDIDPITLIAASQHPLSRQALQQLGVRYRYGGTSPSNGFDCSGLVHFTAKESLGLKLPRRSADIAGAGKGVKRQELVAGDLVFFNTLGARFSHVGIYLGGDLFVHAPSSGGVVRVENMKTPYWNQRFTAARRIEPVMVARGS